MSNYEVENYEAERYEADHEEPQRPIRVLLADDQPLVLSALRMLLNVTPDVALVGEAASGAQAVRMARELVPDVVVMDIRMPGMDGIEATALLTGATGPRVIILTTFDEDDNIYRALRAGASGFLVKDMALEEILGAIRVVASGDALIAPSVTRRLIEEFAGRPDPAPRPTPQLAGITDRERQVLTLVGRGLTNAEIADRLYISGATVKTHLARLFAKLDAHDRAQLVIVAYESGLVTPSR
ncbi:DNA-binding NarL/FixJ family response regulator [Catenulispora sp. GP43]